MNKTAGRSSLDEQIAEVRRELEMRARNYPKFVAEAKIKDWETAVRQMAVMQDVCDTLVELRKQKE